MYKKGDTVVLKNGGPFMTAHETGDYSDSGGPENGVLCVWFTDEDQVMSQIFDAEQLKPCGLEQS